jgi:cathepsin E
MLKITLALLLFGLIYSDYLSVPLKRSLKDNNELKKGLAFIEDYKTQESNLLHRNIHEIQDINMLVKVAVMPLLNYFDIQYYGFIYVGSTRQPLSVIFDTGSNILWLESNECTLCRNHTNKFNPSLSKTFINSGVNKNITYAIGFVNGTLVQDSVHLDEEISVDGLNFLIVNYENQLAGTIADGVLGLGIENEGDEKNSLIYSLYKQGKISSPSFTFYLTETKRDSRLYIGDITENQYLSDIFRKMKHVPVNTRSHYWESDLMSFTLYSHNKTIPNMTYSSTSKVIFDTGTSFLIIPAVDFINIIPAITSKAIDNKCAITPYLQVVCKCLSPIGFSDIDLEISGQTFHIKTENLIEFYPTLDYQCRFEILIDIFIMDSWIIGDNVLRYTLLTFDMNKRTIGYIQDLPRIDDEDIKGVVHEEETKKTSRIDYLIYGVCVLVAIFVIYLFYKCFYANDQGDAYAKIENK